MFNTCCTTVVICLIRVTRTTVVTCLIRVADEPRAVHIGGAAQQGVPHRFFHLPGRLMILPLLMARCLYGVQDIS